MTELEPLEPNFAVEMYLDSREQELAEATLRSHQYRLDTFVEWCENEGIENINNISGRHLHQYRIKRVNKDGLKTVSMRTQLATLKVFLRFCESIDAVEANIEEKVTLPKTNRYNPRDEMVDADCAVDILDHLAKYNFASLEHVLFSVLWHTGIRIGSALSLDIDHYSSKEQYLDLNHQPRLGTPLKNKNNGERLVALSRRICEIIDSWIRVNHPKVTDENDRLPLFCTDFGRLSRNHARRITYSLTRPCIIDNVCPHDRDLENCNAYNTRNKAYTCPSSRSPHPIRRGAITYHLVNETPKEVVEDRMNVSGKILDKHYDERSKKEKMENRRRYLPNG